MRLRIAGLIVLGCLPLLASAAERVGGVDFTRGTVAGVHPELERRTLKKGEPIYRADQVESAPRSFAILRFLDENKLSVRPNSRLRIVEYLGGAGPGSAHLVLGEGGIRGRVGKDSGVERVYNIEAGDIEVEVSDADFDLRTCNADCVEENRAIIAAEGGLPEGAVGRVALLRGKATARGGNAGERNLQLSSPLYQDEKIRTAAESHALLVFDDGGRISLAESSEMKLTRLTYRRGKPEVGEAALELVAGGMRVLSGNIGKTSPEKFRIDTPVATTGIRGTGFDLYCHSGCVHEAFQGERVKRPDGSWLPGLYVLVWSGAIVQENNAGSFTLAEPGVHYIANRDSRPVVLPEAPDFLVNMNAPRPDELGQFEDEAVGQEILDAVPPGQYTHVYSGTLLIKRKGWPDLRVDAGSTVYLSPDGKLVQATGAPAFMARDSGCPAP